MTRPAAGSLVFILVSHLIREIPKVTDANGILFVVVVLFFVVVSFFYFGLVWFVVVV